MHNPKTILITGASSGIGAALAWEYAKPGVTLGLLGRNVGRLSEVAADCTAKGAVVETASIDVRDSTLMERWISQFDHACPIDLLIANAGISAGLAGEDQSGKDVREVFATNLDGVLNSVLPVIPFMRKRKHGQIALMSSLAGIRGLPSCPAYSASKGAVRFFGEGMRGVLRDDNITVSVICPGYIKTPLTDVNTFPMPLIMSAERAAKIMARGLAGGRSRIAFPLALYLPLWFLSCLSPVLTDRFFAALPRKSVMEKRTTL